MDFQSIVDSMHAMTCVVSVEKVDEDRYGKIRLVTGNRAYIDSIEKPAPGVEMLKTKFTPNSEYTDYMTRDLNFEDFCYRAAVKKKCLNSYVHPERFDVWFNMNFIPLDADDGNLCYCLYMMEINFYADTERMSTISGDVASSVLEAILKIRGALDFKAVMRDVIKDIRKLCYAEYCCILTFDDVNGECAVLCEDMSDDTELVSMNNYIDDKFNDLVATWEDTIGGSNCLIVKNEQDLEYVREKNPAWYESLKAAKINNIVLFPLKSHNRLLAYMWVINFDPEYTVKIKETLELATFILGSELGNHIMFDRLRVLSSKDMLTGVFNRNEMNNYVDMVSTDTNGWYKNLGVVFIDLNGLKVVNDEKGHDAGDKLLRDATNALREVFSEEMIFRAGGDEFTIIVEDTTPEDLKLQVEKTKEVSRKYDHLSLAIGYSLADEGSDIRKALHEADENMFKDKHEYYMAHPELKERVKR